LHLDSWKEIAAYLKRDIRTVQRWEKHEGLPVHRHQHDERATTYAYSAEIDRWLAARRTNGTAGANDAARIIREPIARHDVGETDISRATSDRKTRSARAVSLGWAIGGVAIVAGAVAIWSLWPNRQASRPLSSLSIVFPASERFPEWGPDVTLSPDGETLLYTPRGPLRLRRLDELAARPIPGTENAWGPFFSPDGRSIAYFESGRLLRVATEGGAPVVVSEVDGDFIGVGDWGRHNEIVYATPTSEGTHGLYRVPASGGKPRLIAKLEGDSNAAYWLTPQWINAGDAILVTVAQSSDEGTRFRAVTVSVATGEQHLLLEDARHARDIGGILVYWRNGTLFAVRFDSRGLELTGPHVAAWENVGMRVRNRGWGFAGDTLIYWPTLRTTRQLVWVDRQGREESLPMPAAMYSSPRLSPDGRRVAVIIEGPSGAAEFGDVWQRDLTTGANLQLTHGNRSGAIAWSPDGASLIVSMRQGGSSELYRVRADGIGEPERLLNRETFMAGAYKKPLGWSRDGALVVEQFGLDQPRFWNVPLNEGNPPRPIVDGAKGRWWSGSVSADGRWLAFPSNESGRAEVYVTSVVEGRSHWRISPDGGVLPVWGRTGRELFYWSGKRLMAVPVKANSTFTPSEPRLLFEGDYYQVQPGDPNYDVSLDDQRFLLVQRGKTDGPERLNVIQGWRSEIERRLRDAQ
jgi:Tol biopolymer transport system component